MSSFYLNEGWYSSEQLAEVLEANRKMNDHLAKAIGELPEGYKLTTHKLNPESLEGAAGSVVAMTQDKGVKLTFTQHPEILAVDEDADVNPDSLETIEIDLPEPKPVAWMNPNEESDGYAFSFKQQGVFTVPLYAAPPKKEWQGLTDEEIENCFEMSMFGTCRAIEAKLKEKNT